MKVKRLILLVLIVIWAVLIFGLSGQNGTESSGLSRKIVEIFTKDEEIVDIVEPYVRKLAHFSEYGLGGILFISLFSTYKWTDRKMMFVSIALGIWYASMDEIHQLMVDGRHGSIFDVYLDSLGFSTGVCGMMAILKIKEMLNHKNKKIVKRVKNG